MTPRPTGVRCMLMRGGTSKGAFFMEDDLPHDVEPFDWLGRDHRAALQHLLGMQGLDGAGSDPNRVRL